MCDLLRFGMVFETFYCLVWPFLAFYGHFGVLWPFYGLLRQNIDLIDNMSNRIIALKIHQIPLHFLFRFETLVNALFIID